jgi:Na+-transporting methylmalonyl-CoA/oxaloacetate decarboxylase gamma subunit
MAILIVGSICLVFISPPGELTILVYFMMVMGRLCFAANFDDMKECETPESNKVVARCEFARNIPNTTSWDCWASSTVTWLTFP